MKPSIRTISQLTGFSVSTVSNALNGKRGVNKETAEQIHKVAEEIGYSLDPKVNHIRLVIYTDSGSVVNDSPFFTLMFAGIEKECRKFGYSVMPQWLNRSSPEYDKQLAGLLSESSSALMVLGTEMEEAEAAKFVDAVGPVVILDNWYENLPFDAILIDNTDAVCNAVNQLIAKGHKKIGYLCGKVEIKNFYYRKQGYLRALLESGLEYNPKYTFPLTTNMQDAYQDMLEVLQNTQELPTAFFCDNDMIALGAMRACQQCGYRIPEDISFIGFDDLSFSAISNPPLTTVKVYNEELGSAAVRRLVELVNYGKEYRSKIQISSQFVERNSVLDKKAVKAEDIRGLGIG